MLVENNTTTKHTEVTMNSGSVEWLQAIELERDLTLADWNKAKEMEVAGREMSYSDGYREGYKRALELTQWTISNLIPKENESK